MRKFIIGDLAMMAKATQTNSESISMNAESITILNTRLKNHVSR